MLERPLTSDSDSDQNRLLVREFDLASEAFTGNWFGCQLDAAGTAIGDMTAIVDSRFLVIERNGGTATSGTPFKKIFLIDRTLLVVNDNNFPGGGGRNLLSDNTESLRISLANPAPEPGSHALMLVGLVGLGALLRRRAR